MSSMLTRKLSTWVLMGAAALFMSGCSTAVAGSEEGEQAGAVASQELTAAGSEHSVAACGSTCYGPCKTCVLGVCENTCM